MTRSKVSLVRLPQTLNPYHFERSEKSAFDQKLEDSRFLVASLLGMTRRRFEVGARGSNPSFLKKERVQAAACTPFSGPKTKLIFGLEVCRVHGQPGIKYQHCVEASCRRRL